MNRLTIGFIVLAGALICGNIRSQAADTPLCNDATCVAYCQGFCDNTRLRCKETGSGARECRARGYRSCMNGCIWEICNKQPGTAPSYQCKRHPGLTQ